MSDKTNFLNFHFLAVTMREIYLVLQWFNYYLNKEI